MISRVLNALVCMIGVFLIGLSFAGMASATSAASGIGGASAKSPEAYPAIQAMKSNIHREWFWCRIAAGGIVILTICIDFHLVGKIKI